MIFFLFKILISQELQFHFAYEVGQPVITKKNLKKICKVGSKSVKKN